jgi:hypothetical protein
MSRVLFPVTVEFLDTMALTSLAFAAVAFTSGTDPDAYYRFQYVPMGWQTTWHATYLVNLTVSSTDGRVGIQVHLLWCVSHMHSNTARSSLSRQPGLVV